MFKKLRIFFWLGSKDRKEENTRKSQKLIFFSGQEKKLLCCTKKRCSNFLGNLGLKHPSKHGLLEIHICTSVNMKEESREV